jgi:hypothetical protein
MVRIFKVKTFACFARHEQMSDDRLSAVIAQAERGLIDADLGSGLLKLRVARPGQGKRGGYRVLFAFRAKLRAVFLFGFAKNDLDNIADDQLATLREISASWLAADAQHIEQAIQDGLSIEVRHEN